jgi:hypothetical protein
MTPLLRRVATCAGLTAIGLSARAEAQIPTKPEPVVGAEIRRPLPTAPAAQQGAPPVIQQSPNGLYALSITDEGIELRGPSGGVKITNAGIEIGAPNSSRVTISAAGMELWGDKALRLNAHDSVEIVNGPGINIVRLSPAGMELIGQGPVQVKGTGTVEIANGTGPGMNVVRLSNTGVVLTGGKSLQMNSRESVEIVNGPGANVVKLSPTGMELTGKGAVQVKGQTVELVNGTGPATSTVRLSTAGGMELKAGGTMGISGGTRVTLGCPGGRPAARIGDAVQTSPVNGVGVISGGTTKVLICD